MSSLNRKTRKTSVVRHQPRNGKVGQIAMKITMFFASFGGTRSRFATGLAVLMAAVFLAACGGGGSGGGNTTDATITVTSVTPVDGSTDIEPSTKVIVNFTLGTASAFKSATSTIACGGTSVAGTFTRVGNSIETTPSADLPLGKSCAVHTEVTAQSTNGGQDATTSTDVTFTVKAALQYGQVVYAGTGALPLRIIRNTDGTFAVERTVNNSTHKTGVYPLTHCAHYVTENFFGDGRQLWNCRDVAGAWWNLALDPVANTLSDYTGSAPARVQPTDPNWIEFQDVYGGGWGLATEITEGWYYTTDQNATIYFKTTGGVVSTALSGDPLKLDENLRSLVTYSHP